jgi:hypothetical protein
MQKYEQKKKKVGTHEGPKVLNKKRWAHVGSYIYKKKKRKMIAMSQNKKLRERSYLQKYSSPYSSSSLTFHTHAHFDLRVWHFSPWILDLTLQYMQYKYVILFIPI